MNLSAAWLRDLVGFDLAPRELAERLTRAGCAVEELHELEGDVRLVAEVTTNRPDWLGHWGVAREIAALLGTSVRLPAWSLAETGPEVSTLTKVEVEDPVACPRYTARVIRGVRVGPSPAWLKTRLEAIGLRSINNVVDVTNYVLMEMSQPLHAFDLSLLAGGRIRVRRACPGERMRAIDGTDCRLDGETLVIADAQRPVAIAGIMGGAETEVSAKTTDLLLESACFDPRRVRRTSRALRLASDSSYRFERGIDAGAVERASARAAALILEVAGGTVARGVIDTAPRLGEAREVQMRFARCTALLGAEIAPEEIERIFLGLGLAVLRRNAKDILVRVPSFRADLAREVDLIEEVVRLAGLERVPERIALAVHRQPEAPAVPVVRTAREVLVGLGAFECITDSFVPAAWLRDGDGTPPAPIRITNPVNAERPFLRCSLLPSLLEVRRTNRLESDVRLFEIGRIWPGRDGPPEERRLALLDDRGPEAVRGALEEVLAELRLDAALEVVPEAGGGDFAPGGSALLRLNGKTIGRFGLIGEETLARHDLREAPAALEIDLAALAGPRRRRSFTPLPRFPAVRRDIALVVSEAVHWAEIERLLAGGEALESIAFQSVFRGKGVEAGCKSVAFALTLRLPDRSLTDEEANAIRDRFVARLCAAFPGAKLR